MSRCLRPGRILPFSRRLGTFRLPFLTYRSVSPFSRPTWTQHTSQSRNDEKQMNYPDEIQFLRQYNNVAHPPLSHYQKRDINQWIQLLRRCAPSKGRKAPMPTGQPGAIPPLHASKHILDRTHALMGCLWDARMHFKFELLVHLCFECKEWSTVQSLLGSMIDTYELLAAHGLPSQPSLGFNWDHPYQVYRPNEPTHPFPNSPEAQEPIAEQVSLSKLSAGTKSASCYKWTRLEHIPTGNFSLDTVTVEPAVEFFGDRILAELLASLGSLVLAAADSTPEQSQHAMSCVFRALARLHHAGMISDKIYQYSPSVVSQSRARPPGLHLLSNPIMGVLSDAAWHEHEEAVAAAAADAGEISPFIPYKMGIRELGPEIWLELILWCCVEHGSSRTGSLLVQRMNEMTGERAWKTQSWEPLLEHFDKVKETNIDTEQSWRRPDQAGKPETFTRRDKPPFNGLGKRTISAEVVASLQNSLSDKAYVGMGDRGYLPEDIIKLSVPFARLLDPTTSKTGLQPTHRHTNRQMLRILNSGCLQPWSDPVAFESVLRSYSNVVPPWETKEMGGLQHLNSITRKQFYDETAAFFGMIEFNLNYYARDKQSGRLFSAYAWLQNISDASKALHMQPFFEQLSQAGDKNNFAIFSPIHGSSSHQTSLPQVSNVTFANLLDVVTSTHAFDFGRQLLMQDEMDGFAIPSGSYGDQALVPSLLRFATATTDSSLGQKIISSIKVPLSVNTIKCLINYHLSQQSWDRVELMLEFLVEHRSKSWGYTNLAVLASTVIRLEARLRQKTAAGTATEADTANLTSVTDIMLRLYRGEWHASSDRERVRFFQLRALARMHRVLSSIPGPMSEIFTRLEKPKEVTDHHKVALIPPVSFHEIYSAIVETQGAIVGKQVWDKHVIDMLSPKRDRQAPGGVSRLLFSEERHKEFGAPDWSPDWVNEIQRKSTLADLNTVRILARTAVREYAAQTQSESDGKRHHSHHSKTPPHLDHSSSFSSTYNPPESYVPSITPDEYPHQLVGGQPPSSELEAILDFCLENFLRLGLPEDQLDQEIPGHMRRMQCRKVFPYPVRRPVRQKIKFISQDPYIQSFWVKTLKVQPLG